MEVDAGLKAVRGAVWPILSALVLAVTSSLVFGCVEMLADRVLYPGAGYGAALAADGVLALAILPLVWRVTSSGPGWEPVTEKKFSVAGWVALFCVLFVMYVGSEMTGLWLLYSYPDVGATQSYAELTDTQLYLYSIRGLVAAPFLEEFTCRFLLFRPIRAKVGFWPGVVVSALYFCAIHGTLMHIPLAVGLTLFNCVVYDATGKYRYCVLFHMVFNWFAVAVVFSVSGFPARAQFAVLAASYVLIVLMYVFRKKLFDGVLPVGASVLLERFLDGELDRLAGKAEGEGPGAVKDSTGSESCINSVDAEDGAKGSGDEGNGGTSGVG